MRNYALIKNGIVINVSTADDSWDSAGWVEYTNASPCGIGWTHNLAEDIFITPQPYPSWVRSGSFWDAPIPMPIEDGKFYQWVEADLNWQEILFND